ncbi:hypothetical protein GCM10007301_17000 [Azorhizobium oxalatiphilum]|uniref:Protein kinase domain-containing protein n=1 Tax=Azorhizobium oxalatiphilum TaxID=980631 RepID=A0A917BW32_9HYPH|nr:serine/threonine-protein kinase [Azorhizobium oxalatiphilum]GGF57880.1 hypothetical protein GCM10007301_17000 [Azorhizobium oxalatiphilum]
MDDDRDAAQRMGALLNRFVIGKLPFPALVREMAPLCRAASGQQRLQDLLQQWVDTQAIGHPLAESILGAVLDAAATPPPAPAAPERADPAAHVEDALLGDFVGRYKKVRTGAKDEQRPDTLKASLSAYDGLRQRRYARETTQGTVRAPLQANPAAEARSGMVLRDRFILEDEIGRGGMGIVFRAVDRRRLEAGARQPYVAIKMLNLTFGTHPEALRSLEAEARRTQDLADPRITTVYDFDREGNHAFIVMELLEGTPLDKVLRKQAGFCGSEQALRVLKELAETLAFTHSRGAIHADLKPGNLFLCSDGRFKVLDFGISAAVGPHQIDEAPIAGLTPAYASPERVEGGPPSASDDVYAIGCLAHLLMTGLHPFDRKSGADAKAQHMEPPDLPMLPAAARRAIEAALSFDPDTRPADAGAFLRVFNGQDGRAGIAGLWSALKNG